MQMRKMTEVEQRMTHDLDWSEHAPEAQENPDHYRKFVVVYNKRILAVGKESQPVVEQAAEQAGVPWQELVRRVGQMSYSLPGWIPGRRSP